MAPIPTPVPSDDDSNDDDSSQHRHRQNTASKDDVAYEYEEAAHGSSLTWQLLIVLLGICMIATVIIILTSRWRSSRARRRVHIWDGPMEEQVTEIGRTAGGRMRSSRTGIPVLSDHEHDPHGFRNSITREWGRLLSFLAWIFGLSVEKEDDPHQRHHWHHRHDGHIHRSAAEQRRAAQAMVRRLSRRMSRRVSERIRRNGRSGGGRRAIDRQRLRTRGQGHRARGYQPRRTRPRNSRQPISPTSPRHHPRSPRSPNRRHARLPNTEGRQTTRPSTPNIRESVRDSLRFSLPRRNTSSRNRPRHTLSMTEAGGTYTPTNSMAVSLGDSYTSDSSRSGGTRHGRSERRRRRRLGQECRHTRSLPDVLVEGRRARSIRPEGSWEQKSRGSKMS